MRGRWELGLLSMEKKLQRTGTLDLQMLLFNVYMQVGTIKNVLL